MSKACLLSLQHLKERKNMGLFALFKRNKKQKEENKKRNAPSEEDLRINKMWDLWAEEKLPSPVADLMLYQAEVNNGGHDQFFLNLENRIEETALSDTMRALRSLLSGGLLENLENAYSAYKSYDDDEDKAIEKLDECDDYYYEHEDEINRILDKLWAKLDI